MQLYTWNNLISSFLQLNNVNLVFFAAHYYTTFCCGKYSLVINILLNFYKILFNCGNVQHNKFITRSILMK